VLRETILMKLRITTFAPLISIVLLINSSFTHVQANQLGYKHKTKRTMNNSEAKIIADIKKACTLLSSNAATLASIASEFGTPKQQIPNTSVLDQKTKGQGFRHETYGVEPFNHDLERVRISGDASISFYVKPESSISIDSLEEEFGEYDISPGQLAIAQFRCKSTETNQQSYSITVLYNDKNEQKYGSAYIITINHK
jgi:hypothetical protein